jgi:hypothetical protein
LKDTNFQHPKPTKEKINTASRVAQMLECLPSKLEALSTEKKKKKEDEEEEK